MKKFLAMILALSMMCAYGMAVAEESDLTVHDEFSGTYTPSRTVGDLILVVPTQSTTNDIAGLEVKLVEDTEDTAEIIAEVIRLASANSLVRTVFPGVAADVALAKALSVVAPASVTLDNVLEILSVANVADVDAAAVLIEHQVSEADLALREVMSTTVLNYEAARHGDVLVRVETISSYTDDMMVVAAIGYGAPEAVTWVSYPCKVLDGMVYMVLPQSLLEVLNNTVYVTAILNL